MIYTVTFNPSLDYVVGVPQFQMEKVNRTSDELILPGGKGINVSIVLHNLGVESVPIGFTAGFTGEEIKRLLSVHQVEARFIDVPEGMSRINVKIRSLAQGDSSNVIQEGEINGMGPVIDEKSLHLFFEQLDLLGQGDLLVLAGSIPGSLPETMYSDVLARVTEKGVLCVVDASGKLLLNVLKYHPFLIKPNHHELGEMFGVQLENYQDVICYAQKLREMGAGNVLVSMAGDGAVLVTENGTAFCAKAPNGKVVNSVGAGDSMVAGFLYGYLEYKDYQEAFKYGVCTGSASAFSENLAVRGDVELLCKQFRLEQM